ncbi:endolytic transglycosylase MltG [Citricoccus sp. NPDC055426]|uniref:endolytic transglycosylase MltG n=1 Tax=Citricoccus sp. NPDC055426 TaxID=3155536 RepID=UPI00342E6B81
MADLTPEGPGDDDTPVTRRELRRRESVQDGSDGSAAPGPSSPPVGEDRREYPDAAGDGRYAPKDSTSSQDPVIVRPAGRKGYQTVTVNRDRSPEAQLKKEARRKRRRRRNVVLISAFAAFVVLVAGLSFALRTILPSPAAEDYPGPGGEDVSFTVNEGEGALAIGNRLAEQDIVASSGAFIEAVNQSRSENSIQAGDYPLKLQMKAADAAAILLRDGQGQVHYVAVNRGMRLNEAIQAISESTGFSVGDLEAAAENPEDFGLPAEAPSLEGYLAPGEYRFPVDAEPAEIFAQMIEPTMAELEEQGITEEADQFRTVTIASILEAEALPDDYPIVAGIIENRLHPDNPETGGYLQIDATVIYGLGQRQLQFSEEDKQDASNVYNTYAHRGLPPGPIGAPSTQALDAAAHPEENDYYYWVTTNIETGETKFAEDYAQHRVYQQEYRDYCAENEEICG